jgi:gliding motility-associated-like protein
LEEKNNIEQLFREAFDGFEEPVRPELWSKVNEQLGYQLQPSPDVASTASTSAGTQWIAGSMIKWIAGAAIVVTSGIVAYQYTSDSQKGDDKTAQVSEPVNQINSEEVFPVLEKEHEQVGATTAGTELKSNSEDHISDASPSTQNTEVLTESAANTNISGFRDDPNIKSASATVSGSDPRTAPSSNIQPLATHPVSQGVVSSETTHSPAVSGVKADKTSGTAPLTVTFYQTTDHERVEWDFADGVMSTEPGRVEHTFSKPGSYPVRFSYWTNSGIRTSEILTIQVMEDLTIPYIPNVFTPNNDGLNDFFSFDSNQFTEIEVNIYDKSGKFIFRFTDTEKGWDGKLNTGREAPDGTYLYIIFATSVNNQPHQQKGFVRLIR